MPGVVKLKKPTCLGGHGDDLRAAPSQASSTKSHSSQTHSSRLGWKCKTSLVFPYITPLPHCPLRWLFFPPFPPYGGAFVSTIQGSAEGKCWVRVGGLLLFQAPARSGEKIPDSPGILQPSEKMICNLVFGDCSMFVWSFISILLFFIHQDLSWWDAVFFFLFFHFLIDAGKSLVALYALVLVLQYICPHRHWWALCSVRHCFVIFYRSSLSVWCYFKILDSSSLKYKCCGTISLMFY